MCVDILNVGTALGERGRGGGGIIEYRVKILQKGLCHKICDNYNFIRHHYLIFGNTFVNFVFCFLPISQYIRNAETGLRW